MDKRKIIIDCDPGIDDAVALSYAAAHQDFFDVLAVTTVSGNQNIEQVTRNALNLTKFWGMDVPVAKGMGEPLVRKSVFAADVHGENGLGGCVLPESDRKIEEKKHRDVIVKYITEDGEELSRETDNGLVGETFHFEEKTFEGYEVVSRPDSLDGEYIEGTIELVFVLRPVEPEIVEGTIIVKFVDKNGNVLRQQVVSKDLVGEDYYLEAPEIDGYHVVGEDKVRATYVDGELVFEIVYDKDEEIPADPDPHEDPAPTPTPEPEPQSEEPKTVDTSDMNMAMVLVIAVASIVGITIVKKYVKE